VSGVEGAIWAIVEVDGDGHATKLATELATAARTLAAARGCEAAAIVVAPDPSVAAAQVAAYVPRVLAVATPAAADRLQPAVIASAVAAIAGDGEVAWLLCGATPDGRDVAGMLAVLLDLPVAWNADGLAWSSAGPIVESVALGGRAVISKAFTGHAGIVVVRAGTVAAAEGVTVGRVEAEDAPALATGALPTVRVVETLPAEAAAASIDEARVVVVGGRGIGGPEGFAILGDIAAQLGGAVGASRAAVDAGWMPFSIQVGQTGRTIRPAAYLGFGVSGAIQHTVGMRSAGTIVVVNRDPDAPFAELADLFVVGDLATIAPALAATLRARRDAGG
jgi:electron transfer flavoprotein alpha subunit